MRAGVNARKGQEAAVALLDDTATCFQERIRLSGLSSASPENR